MPSGVDEATWDRAKGQAEKQGKGDNYPYVMSIYKSMSGQKKTASILGSFLKTAEDDPMPPLPTPILNAIDIMSKDDWYGFKLDKNKYDTPTMRVFSPKGDPSYIVPVPETLAQAGKSIDWMTLPRDNIDGTAKTPEEKDILDRWDPMINKKASLVHAIYKLGGSGPHTYSSTQIQLPDEIADAVKSQGLQIPDENLYAGEDNPDKDAWNGYGRESDFHVTVKYGLHTSKSGDVLEILSGEKPIRAKIGKISLFEQDDHDVVKFDIVSDDLHRLNKKISDSLEHTTTFPDYKPHATIAYVKKGKGKDLVGDASVTGKEFTVNEITFSSKDGKRTSIKLTGKGNTEKVASLRISPLKVKGKTPGMLRRAANLQRGIGRDRKVKMKTPLVDGISKSSSIPLGTGTKIGLGGVAAGALGYKFGWPWFKDKYVGIKPETVERYRVIR